MKTLITGGAGFIGSAVVPVLKKEGYDIYFLDNLRTFLILLVVRDRGGKRKGHRGEQHGRNSQSEQQLDHCKGASGFV